jgi:hypothetical protein
MTPRTESLAEKGSKIKDEPSRLPAACAVKGRKEAGGKDT